MNRIDSGYGFIAACLTVLFASCPLLANPKAKNVILFSRPSDTISVSAGTTLSAAVTIEARVLFTGKYQSYGLVFNEWTSGYEDKALAAGGGTGGALTGYAYPATAPPPFYTVHTPIALNQWHDIAFVYNGADSMLFLDGNLIGSRPNTGPIGNGPGNPFIGAIFRDGFIAPSFSGYLSSLRVSKSARYSGNYTPHTEDYANDADTVLLFGFNAASGTTSISDGSSTGAIGRLGSGFTGATSPTFMADPVWEPSGHIVNNAAAFGGGPISTFDSTTGATVASFVPTGAFDSNNGRGVQVIGNNVYYTELSNKLGPTDFIRVAPYNDGAGGPDIRTLPNPRPGVGIQELAYHNGVLYALTGQYYNPPIVYGLDPVTGAIRSVVPIDPTPGCSKGFCDGFTVLPNGNFLINTFDQSCTYNQFSPVTGQVIPGTTIVPAGHVTCTGVDTDGSSLFFMTDIVTSPTIVQTTLSGILIASIPAPGGFAGEDMSTIAFEGLVGGLPGAPGQSNCYGTNVSFLSNTFGTIDLAAQVLGTTVRDLEASIKDHCQ